SLPQGLTQLSANLAIGNTDLLSFVDYTSPNQVALNGNAITITGNPIKTTGNVLAELHYRVFLTNDSTTSITFSNVSFNNSDPDYANCVATVQGAANSGYNYEFRCAEHTIAKLLRNESIRISSINPNPTQGEITVTIESPIKTEGILEIYDILGKQVLSESKQLSKGSNRILLDTKSLARGRYSLQLKTNNTEIQGAFVKE
ncbi:MAG TPA: T9SS type A sorting domain-containing protein, partial [Candidatus Kapabacteria bacterium]|nr:T9SS type A sorting domain-containing protein [Candidatus Kapabacteria bacterium]